MSDRRVIEAMLLRWGESPTGRTVTFLLPEDTDTHPFKGLKTGPSNGQRLALSVALIADDETTKEHEPAKPKGGKLAQQAGIMCAEPAFWTFMNAKDEDVATACLREYCGIESRAELDHDEYAAIEFRKLKTDYDNWCNGRTA